MNTRGIVSQRRSVNCAPHGLMSALVLLSILFAGCRSLFDEDADSYVTKDFLFGNWRIWSIRLGDGLTLSEGENGFAGQPEAVWTLAGSASFTQDRADIQYSIIVAVGANPPDTTTYTFVGVFDVDRNSFQLTQDGSGQVVRMTMRRNNAAILVGQRMLENVALFDGDGNESLWVRR